MALWLIPLLVTNSIKLVGLAIALDEIFIQAMPRTLEVLLAGAMMTGMQITEPMILRLFDRVFLWLQPPDPEDLAERDRKKGIK